MAKCFWDNAALKRVKVVMIYDDRNKICSTGFGPMVGKIVTLFPDRGERATTILCDYSLGRAARPQQEKSCRGTGYDKQAAALEGMMFGFRDREVRLTENWKDDLAKVGYKTVGLL